MFGESKEISISAYSQSGQSSQDSAADARLMPPNPQRPAPPHASLSPCTPWLTHLPHSLVLVSDFGMCLWTSRYSDGYTACTLTGVEGGGGGGGTPNFADVSESRTALRGIGDLGLGIED